MMSVVDESMRNVQRREQKRMAFKVMVAIGACALVTTMALMGSGLYTLLIAPDVVTTVHPVIYTPVDTFTHSRDAGWGLVWLACFLLVLSVPFLTLSSWFLLIDET